MDWKALKQAQRELDQRIIQEQGLDPSKWDFMENMILALRVEIAEYANETRCFKQWSRKPPAPKERRMEEWVDALHFYLSLSNSLMIHAVQLEQAERIRVVGEGLTLTMYINRAFDWINMKAEELTPKSLLFSLQWFLGAAERDGFTLDELEAEYYRKNEINHKRQDEGY